MKTLLPYLLILTVAFLSTGLRTSHSVKTKLQESHGFTADSGYILKKEAIKLLSQAKYDLGYEPEERDTFDLELINIEISDTIGKYYQTDNGNYLAFLRDIVHPDRDIFVLMEVKADGTVLQSEPYWTGVHQCCWEKGTEGFMKYANGYFGTQSCGTGSGHCSSYIYMFKDFSPQGEGICSYIWTGWCQFTTTTPIACFLTSDMEIKNDTVTMHYTMEHLKERRNGKYKVIDTEKFDVKYVAREQGWVALDSTKIREFPD